MTTFVDSKIQVRNPEFSKAIQEALFSQGYIWHGRSPNTVQETAAPFLYTNKSGMISYGHGIDFFLTEESTEILAVEKKTIEFVHKIDTIEVLGNIYDKYEYEQAIAKLRVLA